MKNYHEEITKIKELVDLTERLFLTTPSEGNKRRFFDALRDMRILQENKHPNPLLV